MRNISFFITTRQFLNHEKDVTRRLGWKNLKEGEILMGVEKAQGLRKGEKINHLGKIKVTCVSLERLDEIKQSEVYREGFTYSPKEFIDMFCKSHKGCTPETEITRIQFIYL